MDNRKLRTAPVPKESGKSRKPGDYEPVPHTKEPLIVDPPQAVQNPCPTGEGDAVSRR